MRSFIALLVLLAIALLGAAVLAYPAWLAVGLVSEQPIHRVMHRIAMLIALLGFIWLSRRLGIANREALGFGLPRPAFLRQLALGMMTGTLIMLPLILTLLALGIRIPRPELTWTAAGLAALIAIGLASGLVIALIEETFFRGAVISAVRRDATALAVVLSSALYASVHFLSGRLKIPADQVEWSSGLAVFAKLFEQYSQPAVIYDSLLALFTVGVLLSLVRLRTNAIAAGMGMHASWVCIIAVMKETTHVDASASTAWLVGSYDGVIGWGAVGWMTLLAVAYSMWTRTTKRGLRRRE